ncbi:MAG: hypothetical protein NFCOHLIN_01095 [Gammaproteobacteria bacterium]|nr:hypothetical protein [Gammaproteobacteria bacterium]
MNPFWRELERVFCCIAFESLYSDTSMQPASLTSMNRWIWHSETHWHIDRSCKQDKEAVRLFLNAAGYSDDCFRLVCPRARGRTGVAVRVEIASREIGVGLGELVASAPIRDEPCGTGRALARPEPVDVRMARVLQERIECATRNRGALDKLDENWLLLTIKYVTEGDSGSRKDKFRWWSASREQIDNLEARCSLPADPVYDRIILFQVVIIVGPRPWIESKPEPVSIIEWSRDEGWSSKPARLTE